jgi:hypothetical protein
MSASQQPKHKPPTPEEIIRQQTADAKHAKYQKENPAQAPLLPDIVKTSVPAAPDNRTAAEKLVDTVAPSFAPGPIIKFNGKDGQFEPAGGGDALDETTRYAALIPEMWSGFIKFNGEGEQPTRIGGLPYDGYTLPPRESLGDLDPDSWPAGLDGKPSDPWLHQMLMPLLNVATSELVAFQTTSVTGRSAVGQLMRSYNRMRQANPGEVPIVLLKPSAYEHRTFGRVHVPTFVVVGRIVPGGTKPIDDMNDEIPHL